MSSVVAVCRNCGTWAHLWAGEHLRPGDVAPPDLRAVIQRGVHICATCRHPLTGSVAEIKNLPAELRPYDLMTDRSRQLLEPADARRAA